MGVVDLVAAPAYGADLADVRDRVVPAENRCALVDDSNRAVGHVVACHRVLVVLDTVKRKNSPIIFYVKTENVFFLERRVTRTLWKTIPSLNCGC